MGAGPSGIAAAKVLQERGLGFDWFEEADRPGGVWAIDSSTRRSGAYRHLHTNTSKPRTAYPGFPHLPDVAEYPHHTQMLAYLLRYMDYYGLRKRLTTGRAVVRATPVQGGWDVELSTGEHQEYAHVVVATGHLWQRVWPAAQFDEFDGEVVHSREYLDPRPYSGQRVVVVGLGNTAADVAVALAAVAAKTYLSARSGSWWVPKYLFGRPVDQLVSPAIPTWLRARGFGVLLKLLYGVPERYGLPAPGHRPGDEHPLVNSGLLDAIIHGDIEPRKALAGARGTTVTFADGSTVEADAIICCTGYVLHLPFLDDKLTHAKGNYIDLFHRFLHPELPGLYFVGFLQPMGSILPIAAAQSEWLADCIQGRYLAPEVTKMRHQATRYRRWLRRRFPSSGRHAMECDMPEDYLRYLRKELKAGRRRAAQIASLSTRSAAPLVPHPAARTA